ncbi:hypothetical protein MTsPCn5_08370 [Croceitalea sp. MTPC5]|nr:hypothetical protein MTsPCn5_08370 [Croceitalea sp. MTPC5]
MKSKDDTLNKFVWKKEYTIVLVLNTFYILLFLYIMKANI